MSQSEPTEPLYGACGGHYHYGLRSPDHSGHYTYDLRPCQSNKGVQVAEPESNLNPSASLLVGHPVCLNQIGLALLSGRRVMHHVQECQGRVLNFPN